MNLNGQINADFITALKAQEKEKKTFLGLIRGEIKNEELRGTKITDETVTGILRRMEKSLKTTNTPESLGELAYLKPYLPEPMSEERIYEIINGYKNGGMPQNIGRIMGEFNKNYSGQADNAVVSRIIKEILSNEVNG